MTLEDQLIRDEGEILHAYTDSLGYITIGVGHLIDQRKGGSIPQVVSRELLAMDIEAKTDELTQALDWFRRLDPVRQAVFINMAFNVGVQGILKFVNTLAAAKMGDYATASEGMLQSLWAEQTGDRAKRLAQQMLTGEWQ